MIRIASADLWEEIESLVKKTKTIKAAVAYVSDESSIAFGDGDTLVVDASDSSIAGGRTSASVLEAAYNKGATLYSCDTLHGKVLVFDHEAYIGSANISENSKRRLDEVGLISDHPEVMAGAIQFVDNLANKSILVDETFISRIQKIKVESGGVRPGKKARNVQIERSRTWMVSTMNDVEYPGDEEQIEKNNQCIQTKDDEERAWFWVKRNRNRFCNEAKIGDAVILIDREKKKSKAPEYVYKHAIIKDITSEEEIGVKTYHYTYVAESAMEWDQFKGIAEQAGITGLGSGLNTVREVHERSSNILFEMWWTN